MIPHPALDPSVMAAIPEEEWLRPLSQEDQDAIRMLCIQNRTEIPACLDRRDEPRATDPNRRAEEQ